MPKTSQAIARDAFAALVRFMGAFSQGAQDPRARSRALHSDDPEEQATLDLLPLEMRTVGGVLGEVSVLLRSSEAVGVSDEIRALAEALAEPTSRLPLSLNPPDIVVPRGFLWLKPQRESTLFSEREILVPAYAWAVTPTGLRYCTFAQEVAEDFPTPVFGLLEWDSHLEVATQTDPDLRFLLAFLLLANQRLASVEAVPPWGFMKRTAKRADIAEWMRVITLRRVKRSGSEPAGQEVAWSHRWVVKAHWQRVACGEGRLDRRWVLRAAHVKGPPDKPLRTKTSVFSVSR